MNKNNHCFLVGHVGMDPVERGPGGRAGAVVGFTVAENVHAFDEETQGFRVIHTNWFQVTTFGNTADRVKNHIKKGDRVAIQGRMKTSRYKDKTGNERTGFEIIADGVALWKTLGGFEQESEQAHSQPSEDSSSTAQEHANDTAKRPSQPLRQAPTAKASGRVVRSRAS